MNDFNSNKNIPLVSVCMITYNHELFIAQAIENIINQETSFPFELVISNDASLDKTHQAILRLTDNLPKHITLKYFNQYENLGLIPNAVFALKQCGGKYISFCEGDDYWTDTKKLERQITFLESHPEYNVVTGAVKRLYQNNGKFSGPIQTSDYDFNYKDMIVKNHCPTCATTFKNYIKEIEDFHLFENRGIDSQIWIRALGATGKGRFLGNTVAVYRKHEGGATTLFYKNRYSFEYRMAHMERKISKAKFWDDYFDNNARKSVDVVQLKMLRYMIKLSLTEKKIQFFPYYFLRYLKSKLLSILHFS